MNEIERLLAKRRDMLDDTTIVHRPFASFRGPMVLGGLKLAGRATHVRLVE